MVGSYQQAVLLKYAKQAHMRPPEPRHSGLQPLRLQAAPPCSFWQLWFRVQVARGDVLLARELPSCPSSTKLRVPSSLPATTNRQIHVHYGNRGGQGSRRLRRVARRRGPDPITIARLDWTLAKETLVRVGDLDRSSPSLLPSCSQRPLRRGRLSPALVLVSLQLRV